jgi:hypothetical protein
MLFEIIQNISYISETQISGLDMRWGWTTGRSGFDPRQGQKIFSSSLCVQTGFGAHPASCTMGTGGPFPGGKAVILTTHPHLVPRSRMSRSYTSSPPKRLHGV